MIQSNGAGLVKQAGERWCWMQSVCDGGLIEVCERMRSRIGGAGEC